MTMMYCIYPHRRSGRERYPPNKGLEDFNYMSRKWKSAADKKEEEKKKEKEKEKEAINTSTVNMLVGEFVVELHEPYGITWVEKELFDGVFKLCVADDGIIKGGNADVQDLILPADVLHYVDGTSVHGDSLKEVLELIATQEADMPGMKRAFIFYRDNNNYYVTGKICYNIIVCHIFMFDILSSLLTLSCLVYFYMCVPFCRLQTRTSSTFVTGMT